jgi:hypothetical protein
MWDGQRTNELPPLHPGNRDHCAIAFNGSLFVIGGALTAEAFSIQLGAGGRAWTKNGALNVQRRGAAATIVNGKIVVMGGIDQTDTYLDSCEQFDGSGWQLMDMKLPVPMAWFGAIPIRDHRIAILGGRTSSEDKDEWKKTFFLNFNTGAFKEGPELQRGGYFSTYQPTKLEPDNPYGETIIFNTDGQLIKFCKSRDGTGPKKFYSLVVGRTNR